jgi:hypothetical protein
MASWLSFTRWTLSNCAAQVQELAEGGADRVADKIKDTMLDLGCEPAVRGAAQPLPPLGPGSLSGALREEIERTLQRVSEIVNEEPTGCWSPRTEEQVLALFAELAQLALAQALDLRVRAAEGPLPGQEPAVSAWVHRYRRMLAEEGRWPPAPEEVVENTTPSQAGQPAA